jgi:hypothetical protein
MPEGPDFERQPMLFKGEDFLGDERFGEARIAFDDNGDSSGCC